MGSLPSIFLSITGPTSAPTGPRLAARLAVPSSSSLRVHCLASRYSILGLARSSLSAPSVAAWPGPCACTLFRQARLQNLARDISRTQIEQLSISAAGSRAALRHAERVLPRHHLGAGALRGAHLEPVADELVLAEEVEHVVHGVVGRRLLAKVERVVRRQEELEQRRPQRDLQRQEKEGKAGVSSANPRWTLRDKPGSGPA